MYCQWNLKCALDLNILNGNGNSTSSLATSHHCIIDYFPITAHPQMLYSLFITNCSLSIQLFIYPPSKQTAILSVTMPALICKYLQMLTFVSSPALFSLLIQVEESIKTLLPINTQTNITAVNIN